MLTVYTFLSIRQSISLERSPILCIKNNREHTRSRPPVFEWVGPVLLFLIITYTEKRHIQKIIYNTRYKIHELINHTISIIICSRYCTTMIIIFMRYFYTHTNLNLCWLSKCSVRVKINLFYVFIFTILRFSIIIRVVAW